MKGVLVDENLPAELRLPTTLRLTHVTTILNSPSDSLVWQKGREGDLVILTKDADFGHRILASDPPPWIVHVRVGNLRLQAFIDHLVSVWPNVEALLPKHKLVSVFLDRIEAVE